MNLMECIYFAINNIVSNKLRSFLTMLGIIIGIASVIVIAALGAGGKTFILGQFDMIGANIIQITMADKDIKASDYFTLDDIKNIKETIPDVKAITPLVGRWGKIKSKRSNQEALIMGITNDYPQVYNIDILYGRFVSAKDVLIGKNVIVIDDKTSNKLFGSLDCIGKTIKVGGKLTSTTAIVIGVVKNPNEFIAGFAGEDNVPILAYVPIGFQRRMFPYDFMIGEMDIGVNDYSNADFAADNVVKLLEKTHKNKEKYKAQNLMKQLDKVNAIIDKFTIIILAIAAISLLVGGVGVMNIMLVSVNERTREIGIRKAVGATRVNILIQFLTESVIISTIGGIIGLIFGYGGGHLLSRVLSLNAQIPPQAAFIVVGLTSIVGVFFGIYPASRASKLDPIEALRYE